VGPAIPSAAAVTLEAAPSVVNAPRRRGDSLDEYFDRLSNAFEQAKPADAPPTPPRGLDDLLEERRVPTVDALVGSPNGHVNGSAGALNGHEKPRNPIVDALEALLGPDPVLSQPTLPGLPEVHANGNPASTSSENLADAVTERVLERLLPEITATVQRLVQEEVDRIRQQ
jgi:hypothetical protein